MLRYILAALVSVGIIFGWLKSHDAQVKAEALAKDRRDVLIATAKQKDAAIEILQDSLALIGKSIGKEIIKIKHQRDTVEVQSVGDSLRVIVLQNLINLERDKGALVRITLVDSITDAYEDRLGNMRTQVFIANRLTKLAQDSTKLMTDLYSSEVERNKILSKLNNGFRKELEHPNGNGIGRVVFRYILPTVAVTYGVVKLTESRNSKGTN